MYILKFILLINIFIFMFINAYQALHMFQQNRYEIKRYILWLEKNKFIDYVVLTLSIIILIISLLTNEIVAFILMFLIFSYINYRKVRSLKNKKYIKPLVFTTRVKRQLVSITILNLILLFGFYLAKIEYYSLIYFVVNILEWLLVPIVSLLNAPLEQMVKNYYLNDAKKILQDHRSLKTIAITGSFGKTSSKNILNGILSEKYYCLKTPASYNTPMGITITIRDYLKNIHEVFICEMGAGKVGDIEYLTKQFPYQYALLTTIGPQHLQSFKTQENIILEKFRIIENLPEDGIGFINIDNEFIKNYPIKNKCKIITYGIEDQDADFRAFNINYTKDGSTFDVMIDGQLVSFKTKLLGIHNVSNILGSIAVGYHLNISIAELQDAVSKLDYVEHRLEVKKMQGRTIIDDAFNSNPVGSKMALDVLKLMPSQRVIITPGMIDLGAKQDEYNYKFGTYMLDCCDLVFLVGKIQTKAIYEGLKSVNFDLNKVHICDTVTNAFRLMEQISDKDATVLLENDLPDAFNK